MMLNLDKCKVALTARNKRIIKADYILNGAKSMIHPAIYEQYIHVFHCGLSIYTLVVICSNVYQIIF